MTAKISKISAIPEKNDNKSSNSGSKIKYFSCENCRWHEKPCEGSYGSRKILCDSFSPVEGPSGKFVPVSYCAGRKSGKTKGMSKWQKAYYEEWLKDWERYVAYAEGETDGIEGGAENFELRRWLRSREV